MTRLQLRLEHLSFPVDHVEITHLPFLILRARQVRRALRRVHRVVLLAHLVIDESTLYPLLRRLESQGLLLSEWREEEKRNKRFYRLSPDGEEILGKLLDEWRAINTSINNIL